MKHSSKKSLIERRQLLLRCAALVSPLAAGTVSGQNHREQGGDKTNGAFDLNPVVRINGAYLVAMSPDGSKVSLYFSKRPLTTFTFFEGGQKVHNAGPFKDESLNVLDLGSRESIFASRLPARPGLGSFFSDNERLYIETASTPPDFRTYYRVIIDLRGGGLRQRPFVRNPNGPSIDYCALADGTLLGFETEPHPYQITALIRATLQDYSETARVPYALSEKRGPGNLDTGPFLAPNLKTVAYGVSNTLVVRRTEDLGLVWSRPVEPEFIGVRSISFTPDGGLLAAAVIDTTAVEFQRKYYVGVFRGDNRVPVARLAVNGSQGIAISPDGDLLAVGRRLPKGRDIQLAVQVYRVSTGRMLATVLHDQVPPGRFQDLVASFDQKGVQFTPDGRRLVTSGNNQVRIWDVPRCKVVPRAPVLRKNPVRR